MPPVLHRDPEDRRHRRTGRQVPPQVRDRLSALPAHLAAALLAGALLAPAAAPAASPSGCPADRIDETARSAEVFDGDTLALSDGRHLRLVGINAPEIAHDDRPGEPLGEAAGQALEALVPAGTRLHLRYPRERRDRYGRTLAHAYLDDGRSLEALLLERGLAFTLVVPPNVWGHACYARIEAAARAARRGVWGLAYYGPLPAAEVDATIRGFRLVRGRVQRIGRSRRNLWLNLEGRMALRLPLADLGYFTAYDPAALLGRRVEAHGWIQRRRGEARITIRHPAALRVLD